MADHKSWLIRDVTAWTGHGLPDGSIATTDALAVRDGRIIAMGGTAKEIPVDHTIDGDGAFLAPAFGDGHVHPIFGGLEEQFARVRDGNNVQQIADAVAHWAREHPEAEWIRGEGFDPTLAPGGIFQARWLDEVVADRPVVLRATDYHTVWVNSEALRRAGYRKGVQQPHDGEIMLDEDGNPNGTLREWGAWRPVYDMLPAVTNDQAVAALDYATSGFAKAGISWIQDAWVESHDVELWLAALDAGTVHVDADLALWADPNTWRTQLDGFTHTRREIESKGKQQISAHTVKFFADGVIESGTGALLEPYCDCPHSRGIPNWDPDELRLAVAAVDALGFTPHIHAIGDAAVRNALNAIEHAAVTNSPRDRRWTICHVQLVDPPDLNRFAELGVVANFEPYWSKFDSWQSELNRPRLGEDRLNRQFQTATLLRHGARVSFGSDWPVTTYSPLEGMQVAVTRQLDAQSPPWMPEERITVDQALAGYTSGVAYQSGRDDAGVLRPGARADVVLLGEDPRSVDPMTIGHIPVLGTWRAGSPIYGR
jgi:predicted amidohydrolase YtcJ